MIEPTPRDVKVADARMEMDPLTRKVWDVTMLSLAKIYFDRLRAQGENIGLEVALEAIENLLDKGWIAIVSDGENLWIQTWNSRTGKYQDPPLDVGCDDPPDLRYD